MYQYNEAYDDNALTNFQFDQTGGSAKASFITELGKNIDIQVALKEILGYTNPTSNGFPYLSRTIPATHPKFPFLYAQRIVSVHGKGSGTATRKDATPPSDPVIGANPICKFLAYGQYEIAVEFGSRPYPIVDTDSFTKIVNDGYWYKKDGTGEAFSYAPEWVRYCDYDFIPQDNTIQGQVGSLSLWGIPNKDKGVPFTSPPWMWLPDQILKVKWYQVPYRYITSSNSYIAGNANRNWRGRVNQNAWWNWEAGSLLYMGYSVQKYSPPFNEVATYKAYLPTKTDPLNKGTLANYDRLCDIELTFLVTNRYGKSLGTALTNGNYIPKGHNLLPNLADGKFYYATRTPLKPDGTKGDTSIQNPPAWFSFPLEALFSDPDILGGPTTNGDN